jgi:hypothetical protein
MAHIRLRIEEIEYRSEDKSLMILGVDEFQAIVTLEVRPVYPRQLAADLDFAARHPNARIQLDGAIAPRAETRNEGGGPAVESQSAGIAGRPRGDES